MTSTQRTPIRSVVYVDGFNLYYGSVKHTPNKWLNISKLVQFLLPNNQIIQIKYFTALVKSRPQDPDQPLRQQIYLRALRTIPNLEIVLGHFLSHEVSMPLADCPPGKQRYVNVIKSEEKGSDVNIATHMLRDGFLNVFEAAIIVSNDSDLVEAIKIVKNELGKTVIILNPFPNSPSHELRKVASFVKPIRQGVLAASQFPNSLSDQNGIFNKPSGW